MKDLSIIGRLSDALCSEESYSKMAYHRTVLRATARATSIARLILAAALSMADTSGAAWSDELIEAMCWLFMGIIFRESSGGPALDGKGSGDNGHGWDEPQIDIVAFPTYVAQLRGMVWPSEERLAFSMKIGFGILVDAVRLYSGDPESAACRYNCAPGGVDAGLLRGDPNLRTTGGDYGRWVLSRIAKWNGVNVMPTQIRGRTVPLPVVLLPLTVPLP